MEIIVRSENHSITYAALFTDEDYFGLHYILKTKQEYVHLGTSIKEYILR